MLGTLINKMQPCSLFGLVMSRGSSNSLEIVLQDTIRQKKNEAIAIYFTSNYPAEKHLRQNYIHNLATYLGIKVTVQSLSIFWEEEMTCMTKKSASLLEMTLITICSIPHCLSFYHTICLAPK